MKFALSFILVCLLGFTGAATARVILRPLSFIHWIDSPGQKEQEVMNSNSNTCAVANAVFVERREDTNSHEVKCLQK